MRRYTAPRGSAYTVPPPPPAYEQQQQQKRYERPRYLPGSLGVACLFLVVTAVLTSVECLRPGGEPVAGTGEHLPLLINRWVWLSVVLFQFLFSGSLFLYYFLQSPSSSPSSSPFWEHVRQLSVILASFHLFLSVVLVVVVSTQTSDRRFRDYLQLYHLGALSFSPALFVSCAHMYFWDL
jgi:hypothetical protein